ncbi:hypothetical protein GL218_04941 [Daldinia childiae]|uniref:uncharacterized protein n=1 Tax=Daldinia childiae TaxID=326645 RepID=UPI001448978B|nr:uncharacterized protein GL218_04941 [Daldinia childiae]KAF3059905.1 hypothetical protein GL218_04941 [Daldinia childiae]
MQPRRYPPILPSVPLPEEDEPLNPDPGPSLSTRRQRPGACTTCRRRKIKCDGVRPKCTNCERRAVKFCVYIDKVKAGPEVMELLELLKSLPMIEAFGLLNSLRDKGDPAAVLSMLREGDAEGQSTFLDVEARGLTPRNMLELELMANNSKSFLPLRRIDARVLAKSDLLRPMKRSIEANPVNPSFSANAASEGRRFPPPVDFWTNVMVTNEFTAQVISLYIKTDHPILGLFSPYLFITDLYEKDSEKVASEAYKPQQMYSAFDKDAMQFADEFLHEAQKARKEEPDSYSSMAGAILLSISLIGNSKDHSILFYAKEAMQIGQNLGLFGGDERGPAQSNENMSKEDKTARCYAAWGTFNWNVLVSLFYRQPGAESPSSAPLLPIPGERTPIHQEDDMNENLQADEGLLEMIFPALCHFWQIIHGAAWIYTSTEDRPPDIFRMALAENKFRELIAWAEALPLPLIRTDAQTHHVILLYIWLHCAILDVFRPFVRKSEGERPRLTTFSASDSSPDAACAASVGQLKNLIVEYRSKFVESTCSILWHTGLLYLANAMLKDTSDPDRHLYLMLCLYGYESLSRPFRISEVIVQGLLSMTLKETDMSGSEAQRIVNELKEGRLHGVREDFEHKSRATFMVDLDLALKHPEQARAENLAEEFENLALFRDFLDQERMEISDEA